MTRYPTDLSSAEWDCLESHLPTQRVGGRPRIHSPRTVLDAIFYVLRSGCPWRLLPRDFPPWRIVYHYFRAWRLDGTWDQIHSAVRERVRIPIVGMGGVQTGRHGRDLLDAGADLVAVGTESFRDPCAGARIAAELHRIGANSGDFSRASEPPAARIAQRS